MIRTELKSIPDEATQARRRNTIILLGLAVMLAVLAGQRLWLMQHAAVIAKDGTYLINIAQQWQVNPTDAMQTNWIHPGYSAAVCWVNNLLDPSGLKGLASWEQAGRLISLVSNLLAVLAVWVFAWQAFGKFSIAFAAALLLGLGRKFSALGADVLNDSLTLCFQMWATVLAMCVVQQLRNRKWWAVALAAAVGVLAGLAYLVRFEGIVALMLAMALWVAFAVRHRHTRFKALCCLLVAGAAALAVTLPYMRVIGTMSHKFRIEVYLPFLSSNFTTGLFALTPYPASRNPLFKMVGQIFEIMHPIPAAFCCIWLVWWLVSRWSKRLAGLYQILPKISRPAGFAIVALLLLTAPMLMLHYRSTGAMSARYLVYPASLLVALAGAAWLGIERLIAADLTRRGQATKPAKVISIAIVAGLAIAMLFHSLRPMHAKRRYILEIGKQITQTVPPGEKILSDHWLLAYYSRQPDGCIYDLYLRHTNKTPKAQAGTMSELWQRLVAQPDSPYKFVLINIDAPAIGSPAKVEKFLKDNNYKTARIFTSSTRKKKKIKIKLYQKVVTQK